MLPLRKYHLLLFNYMTMRQRTINNLIEISPQAEGSFLTQAFPTNFHQFYTKKLLTLQESVSDYKEVTAAEKANIINADSQWVEPSEELKATAKVNGAVYNDKTGFFELNTLTDITAEQMRAILNFGRFHLTDPMAGAYSANRDINSKIRTNILVASLDELNLYSTANGLCYGQGLLEVLVVGLGPQYDQTWTMRPKSIFTTLTRCRKLHTIIGDIRLDRLEKANEQAFISCDELRNVRLRDIVKSLDISGAPLLSFDSVAFMVDNAKNTEAISIKVHPDVYAKLTGDTSNAAAAALSADELAQWQALVAQAAEKQITFATTS